MWSKALWYKNYKETKPYAWGFLIVSLLVPFQFYSEETRLADFADRGILIDAVSFDFFTAAAVFQLFVLLVLAVKLMGSERSNYHYAFSLSLPFKREDIFQAKWMYGCTVIGIGVTISVLISLLIYSGGDFLKDLIPLSIIFTYMFLIVLLLLAFYSFALMLGYLTGNAVSQFILTGITSILPVGFTMLLFEFLRIHGINAHIFDSRFIDSFTMVSLPVQLSIMSVLSRIGQQIEGNLILVCASASIGYILITFLVTRWISRYSKAEHNGKILLYQPLVKILRVGVFVCFFLFGGLFGSGYFTAGGGLLEYYIGGIVFALLATIILNKLLRVKPGFKLSRN
ncbi:ABC-2 transporter permease [Bacillus horti]|uniref:ABC-2 type transport system permease protein n=1 Tax=Caldalkalibacillus horti TaxID=77523 RepID=A0ABT9W3M2_9BACI|nr:ABC-2 transporter permease [Bacillus horti]MDQ0167843.1 ABC-2 type transport system permease protein [Bacillus horti]